MFIIGNIETKYNYIPLQCTPRYPGSQIHLYACPIAMHLPFLQGSGLQNSDTKHKINFQ